MMPIDFRELCAVKPIDRPALNFREAALARAIVRNGLFLTFRVFNANGVLRQPAISILRS